MPSEKKYYLAIARELSGGRPENGSTFCFCTRSLNAKRFLCFTLSSALVVVKYKHELLTELKKDVNLR